MVVTLSEAENPFDSMSADEWLERLHGKLRHRVVVDAEGVEDVSVGGADSSDESSDEKAGDSQTSSTSALRLPAATAAAKGHAEKAQRMRHMHFESNYLIARKCGLEVVVSPVRNRLQRREPCSREARRPIGEGQCVV